jgi:ribonuclease G
MSEEILVNVSPMETRVALIESGVVQEIYVERAAHRGLVGNIYVGKVVRVLPGMQAAFVDIGLERAAFIHAKDFIADPDPNMTKEPSIADLTTEGSALAVQVVKDQIGAKGARLTTVLSLPSRYVVYMPYSKHIGVSQRIENEAERERLRALVEKAAGSLSNGKAATGGFIIRTASEGASEEIMIADIQFLLKLWERIVEKIRLAQPVCAIHADIPLYMRTLRDFMRPDIEKIRVDSEPALQRLLEFARLYSPGLEQRLEYYAGERPLFDLYNVEDEIQKALARKVQLKSGGYLVIDQTEAMTTVDVNTGAYVGHRNLEETIFKTNLVIVRQLRLRNLGGIIIVDFIDMEDEEHKREVMRIYEKQLEKDHAKLHITQVSVLGLVEMTRKRTRESLERMLCEPCAACEGRGFIKTAETVCYEIFREITRHARAYNANFFMVIAAQSVIDRLLDEESHNVADLEKNIGTTIRFQVELLYSQEQFDVVLM